MSKIKIFDLQGQVLEEKEIQEDILAYKTRTKTLKKVILAYQANKRQGTASTKTKSEVAGTGAKQWKQKGTGRARAHYKQSNVWRGGYAAFGPVVRSYYTSLPKKQKRVANKDAWFLKLKENKVKVVKGLVLEQAKTKYANDFLSAFEFDRNVLVIVEKAEKNLLLACRNISRVKVMEADYVNAHDLFLADNILVAEEAFQTLNNKYTNDKNSDDEL